MPYLNKNTVHAWTKSWEIILGLSHEETWDAKVLDHLLFMNCVCASLSGLMFSP